MNFSTSQCLICSGPMTYNNKTSWCASYTEPRGSHYQVVISVDTNTMAITSHGEYTLYHFPDYGQTNIWKNESHVGIIPILEIDYSDTQRVVNKLKLITVFS